MNRSGMACMRRPFPMGENDTLKIAVCSDRVKREYRDRQSSVVRSTGRIGVVPRTDGRKVVKLLLLLRNTDDLPKSHIGGGNAVAEDRRCHPRMVDGAGAGHRVEWFQTSLRRIVARSTGERSHAT